MRREPFTVDSYVHVVKRGARGIKIFQDDLDMWRFSLTLYHFNDMFISDNWFRDLMYEKLANTFKRPSSWGKQQPIVSVIAYTLLPNHFHILLKEIHKGGISLFMNRIGKGITQHLNIKYAENGSVFQGPYHSRTIKEDIYFRTVLMYIMIKNTFELYPGGFEKARKDFEKAYTWAAAYPYSSLIDYIGKRDNNPILDISFVKELFPSLRSFKNFAIDYMEGRYKDEVNFAELPF